MSCTDDEVLKQMQDIFEKKLPPSKKPKIVPDNEEDCLETKLSTNTVVVFPEKAKELGNVTFLNGNANKNMPGKEKSGGRSSSMVFNNRLNFMNVTSYIEKSPIWDVTALLNDADIKPLTLKLIKTSVKMEITVYSVDETISGYEMRCALQQYSKQQTNNAQGFASGRHLGTCVLVVGGVLLFSFLFCFILW